MRAGADDYVTKPFQVEVLLRKIASLCARDVIAPDGNPDPEFLCVSAAMRHVKSELLRVKDAPSPVLLLGETGVGKEVAAHLLHDASISPGAALHHRQLRHDPSRPGRKRDVRSRTEIISRSTQRPCRPGRAGSRFPAWWLICGRNIGRETTLHSAAAMARSGAGRSNGRLTLAKVCPAAAGPAALSPYAYQRGVSLVPA
jgi:hypothetical protein